MAIFKVDKTYQTRSICDHNCIITIKVLKRTAKTIKVLIENKEKTLRVFINYNGIEAVRPYVSCVIK